MTHTPTPWTTTPGKHAPLAIGLTSPSGENIATVWPADIYVKFPEVIDLPSKPNAEFIVLAVNSHEALLEALEACRHEIMRTAVLYADKINTDMGPVHLADAAIAASLLATSPLTPDSE